MLRPAVLGLVLTTAAAPAVADPFENFGTAMKYGLPAAAALCALRDDRGEDFAVRGAVQVGLVLALKHLFQDSAIGRRPSGGGDGFPSGHTAAAMFGAADLAGKCFADDPLAGAAVYGAAGMTGLSRIHAGEHTPAQVMSGALIGFSLGAASLGIGTDKVSISLGMRF
ncbi:MAG: phosphatase PAP2 family protein [Paracoccus sp. (in: a-proteobacteria)]|uniref:phosphatase PAP2 family protein n=1 Tax=Paracoccus sp. TaxID=267 RepID=UPI0026E10230|nr:phosphatase PAP2 family protein [Paracoccus sp. (in: a-proteobacteria)]MDO5612064.1 phosphatase PAP2 family protein [Paracoccus sp. (in: a-proteobacteria)]